MATILQFRPKLSEVDTFKEFDRWYWPVAEMQAFCRENGVPYTGLKAELRNRLSCFFRGEPLPAQGKAKKSSWAKMDLHFDTVITEDITFGCNVRGFFRKEIGQKFVCSSVFMKWVKANPGRTLGQAIEYWYELNDLVSEPGFRQEIDRCNNYLQYLRDIRDANPNLSQEDAKRCWDIKSRLPADAGYVHYEERDVLLGIYERQYR